MSKKNKKHKKRNQTNKNKKQNVGLLGDHSTKRKQLLIGISLLSVIAIIIFCFMLPGEKQSEESSDNKQETIQTVGVNVEYNQLVNNEEGIPQNWVVYFKVVTDGTEGTISFTPSIGTLLKQNKMNTEVTELTEISTNELEHYDFMWVVTYKTPAELGKLTATLENKTIKKDASLYTLFEETMFSYMEEEQYKQFERNWEKLITSKEK